MTEYNKGDRLKNSSLKILTIKKIQKMEKIEAFKEFLTLPVCYLVIAVISVFISLVSMPVVNHYAFGKCYDRERGKEIANKIVKVQFFLVVIIIISGITFAIGLCKSGSNFTPFF